MTLDLQWLTIVHMTGAGLFLGMAFDTYSHCFRHIKASPVRFLVDVLFWLLQGIIVFLWLQYVNDGQVRLHIFGALFFGYAIYRALLQSFYLTIVTRAVATILFLWRVLKKVLYVVLVVPFLPFVYILKFIRRWFRHFFSDDNA